VQRRGIGVIVTARRAIQRPATDVRLWGPIFSPVAPVQGYGVRAQGRRRNGHGGRQRDHEQDRSAKISLSVPAPLSIGSVLPGVNDQSINGPFGISTFSISPSSAKCLRGCNTRIKASPSELKQAKSTTCRAESEGWEGEKRRREISTADQVH